MNYFRTTLVRRSAPLISKALAAALSTVVALTVVVEAQGATAKKPAATACTRPIKIMPLGDSLTSFPDSYRGPLFRSLKAKGLKVDFVGSGSWEPTGGGDPHHEGHGGYTIGPADTLDFEGNKANLADNVTTWIPKAKPDIIILSVGTNDVAFGGALVAAAPAKFTALVAQIRKLAPGAVIVVGDVPPTGSPAHTTPEISAINAAAKAAAKSAANAPALYAATFDGLIAAGFDGTRNTQDGTHYTAEGGIMLANVYLPTVLAAIPLSPACKR